MATRYGSMLLKTTCRDGDANSPRDNNEYSNYNTQESPADVETRIPLHRREAECVKEYKSTSEATITKEPVTETKTVEVPVTHEELTVERRPASESTKTTTERPVQSKTDTKVQLNREDVQVTKEPYVKEEVVVKKKPVTETRTVSDTVTSEKIDVSGSKDVERE